MCLNPPCTCDEITGKLLSLSKIINNTYYRHPIPSWTLDDYKQEAWFVLAQLELNNKIQTDTYYTHFKVAFEHLIIDFQRKAFALKRRANQASTANFDEIANLIADRALMADEACIVQELIQDFRNELTNDKRVKFDQLIQTGVLNTKSKNHLRKLFKEFLVKDKDSD